jgi:hypothetical protein
MNFFFVPVVAILNRDTGMIGLSTMQLAILR